jgi:hypothetical protein
MPVRERRSDSLKASSMERSFFSSASTSSWLSARGAFGFLEDLRPIEEGRSYLSSKDETSAASKF